MSVRPGDMFWGERVAYKLRGRGRGRRGRRGRIASMFAPLLLAVAYRIVWSLVSAARSKSIEAHHLHAHNRTEQCPTRSVRLPPRPSQRRADPHSGLLRSHPRHFPPSHFPLRFRRTQWLQGAPASTSRPSAPPSWTASSHLPSSRRRRGSPSIPCKHFPNEDSATWNCRPWKPRR